MSSCETAARTSRPRRCTNRSRSKDDGTARRHRPGAPNGFASSMVMVSGVTHSTRAQLGLVEVQNPTHLALPPIEGKKMLDHEIMLKSIHRGWQCACARIGRRHQGAEPVSEHSVGRIDPECSFRTDHTLRTEQSISPSGFDVHGAPQLGDVFSGCASSIDFGYGPCAWHGSAIVLYAKSGQSDCHKGHVRQARIGGDTK